MANITALSFTARQLRAAVILTATLLSGLAAHSTEADAQPTVLGMAAPPAAQQGSIQPPLQKTQPTQPPSKPLWSELTSAQQQALAPLAEEWNKLDSFRKNKWLAIGNKYATMKPDEQQRMQDRMRDWVKLTPEQRRIARESYARAKKLNPDQKSAQWEQYQQLPEEQKKKLAADAASKKHVATLPATTTPGNHSKTVPPIKSAPKPVIEQSVTPQAASQSAIQSSPPASTK